MTENEEMPEHLQDEGEYLDPDIARAEAVASLHNPKNKRVMAVFNDKPFDSLPARLMYSIGEATGQDWLTKEADRYCELSMGSQKGRARNDVSKGLENTNPMNGAQLERPGFMQRARNFIESHG